METLRQLPDQTEPRPAAVGFGNFDGVHVGHQALLGQLRAAADRMGGPVTVVTFDPHPLQVLRPQAAPPAIDTLEGRLRALQACGVDRALVLPFDLALAARPAEWFAREVLFQTLGARVLLTGPDTRFGRAGQGDVALLKAIGEEMGRQVAVFPGVMVRGGIVSSSRVRAAVQRGDVADAAELLGRPFCLRGAVVEGDKRGRTLGFPTANLAASGQVQPAPGVYACVLEVDGQLLDAVTNAGRRPTFANAGPQIEAHVLDWHGDLYGRQVHLHFVSRVRDERKFASPGALIEQIQRDVAEARRVLTAWRSEARVP